MNKDSCTRAHHFDARREREREKERERERVEWENRVIEIERTRETARCKLSTMCVCLLTKREIKYSRVLLKAAGKSE